MVELRWAEVDPRGRTFDPERVRPALEAIATDHAAKRPDANSTQRVLGTAIEATYGAWARLWTWNEAGPVRGWCCAKHSVFRREDASPFATSDRAIAALASLHGFLVECDVRFARLRAETAGLPVGVEIERAASHLLAFVSQRTQNEDAWYWTFTTVLCWYLEAAGFAPAGLADEIDRIVGGRFESWAAPEPDVARETGSELAAAVVARVGEGELRDALADWRHARTAPVTIDAPADANGEGARPSGEPVDGHVAYIAAHDHARDPERAERMLDALLLCRDSAAHELGLSFDQLAEWQGVVLGTGRAMPLRTTDAFGKRGRETYGCPPDLAEAFDRALLEAGDPALAVAVRAARVYLDVCFFHPFADGNGRAARLALDHVITRAGFALRVAEPAFSLARGADDPAGLWGLATVIAQALVAVR